MSAFDRGAYAERSRTVLDKLQELYEIDLILDGCRAADVFNAPQDGSLDYEAGMGRDYNQTFTITVGRTYPFDLTVHVYREPGKVDMRWIWTEPDRHDYGFLESAPEQARAWADNVRAVYDDLVEPLLRIDSDSYIDAGRVLLRAATTLQTMRRDFAFLSGSDWEGDAATTFFRFFYWQFGDIRENHVWGLEQLLLLTGSLKLVNDVGQIALMNILGAADELLDEQLLARRSMTQKSASRSAVGLVAGVSTVVAGVGAKAPKVNGSFTIVAGALSVLAAIPNDASIGIDVFGTRADDIGEVVGTSLHELLRAVDEKHEHVINMAHDVGTYVDLLQDVVRGTGNAVGFNDWLPIRPGIEAGDDHGFYHQSSGRAS